MTASKTFGVALVLAAATAASLGAQMTKTIPGEEKTVTATVEAIDQTARAVTVKKADGKMETFYVPSSMKRFDALKVGDKVSAKYYETTVLQLKPAGDKDVDTFNTAVTPNAAKAAGGTAARQRVMTVKVTAIDPSVPSITFTGPRNWTYTSRVNDKAALAKVKVGDRIDITRTEALLVSIE
jgi:hypothetical protein